MADGRETTTRARVRRRASSTRAGATPRKRSGRSDVEARGDRTGVARGQREARQQREPTTHSDRDDDGRFERLSTAVAGIRTRAGQVNLERPMLVAGAILLPLGIVAVILGWVGASRTPYTFEQIPYLISGGLLGVALAVTGGFLYFGYWLTRILAEQRTQAQQLTGALERIERLLGGNGAVQDGRASIRAVESVPSGRGEFVATPTGTMFHRPECAVVAERSGLRRVTGREKGYEPCGICNPLAA